MGSRADHLVSHFRQLLGSSVGLLCLAKLELLWNLMVCHLPPPQLDLGFLGSCHASAAEASQTAGGRLTAASFAQPLGGNP